jgi:hypothetical protein
LVNVASDPTFFNPWSDIPPGTGHTNRVVDKIQPVSMSKCYPMTCKQT